jgi:hypothetical protein
MDPKNEREIEQALAALATNRELDPMPADVASRFDAHLNSLLAKDAVIIRTDRFEKSWSSRIVKSSSWVAAASVLTVVALVGVSNFTNDGISLIPAITDEEIVEPTNPLAPEETDNESSEIVEPTTPTKSPEIASTPVPQDGGTVYGNGEDVGNDQTQSVQSTNSGANYGGYLGPIAEKILPLELPGSISGLSSANQACIKSLGISNIAIGIDSGTYKGSKITAYWIATGIFERGAILVSPGCKKITFVKE